jgi:hypothetical protein
MTFPDKTSDLIAQLDVRLERVEEAIADIGPPLDEEPPVSAQDDRRLSAVQVAKRYGVTTRTITRWLDDYPDLGFPKPEVVKHRRYWWLSMLEHWDRIRLRKTMPGPHCS